MAQCLLLDKEKDLLGSLEVGEAVVKLQGRIPRAFQVKVPEFIIDKGTITDDYIREYMQHTSLSASQDSSLYPANENLPAAGPVSHNPLIYFLKDIQNSPESGVAARYKRLGLSVRQGQKLKTTALHFLLIEERIEATRIGRQVLTHLTEKGKAALGTVADVQ